MGGEIKLGGEFFDEKFIQTFFDEKNKSIEKLVNSYIKEVVYPFLPNFQYLKPNDIIRNTHRILFGAVLNYSYANDALAGSDYYYENDELKFIHYTSLTNLLSIIREKSFRLYSLSSMKADPKELNFATKNVLPSVTDDILEKWKQNVFCLSLSEYKTEGTCDSFELWRNYGDNGKGVGIVIKFSENNRFEWFKRHLSKVYYGEEQLQNFHHFYNANLSFFYREKSPIIGNFQELILNLCSFHKTEIHRTEYEVRYIETKDGFLGNDYPNGNYDSILCDETSKMFVRLSAYKKKSDQSSNIYFDIKPEIDIKRTGEIVSFTRLYHDRSKMINKIESEVTCPHFKNELVNRIPEIEIEKIILGYQYSLIEVENLKIAINQLTNTQLGKSIEVEQTILKQFF